MNDYKEGGIETMKHKLRGLLRPSVKITKLLCVVFVSLICCFLSTPLHSAEKVVKLRYAHWFQPTHPHAILIDQWCKEVEKRTDGRVKVTHFPGNILGPQTQTYDSVAKGVIDMGMFVLSYTMGRFPLSEVLDLPIGWHGGSQATKLDNQFYKKFKPKEFDDVKVFYLHAFGPIFIHTKQPISKLEEIKELRIKATGMSSKIVAALGGTPVTIPITEAYDALKRGLADGLIINNEVLKTFRFGEVVKTTVIDHGMSGTTTFMVAMNKEKWNSLPKDIQQIIDKINEEWIEKTANTYIMLEKIGEDYLVQSGNNVVKVSKEEEAKTAAKMKPIIDEYVQSTTAKGLPGDKVLEFCVDYLRAHP
jgi:TRAP-type C4-dicarboxylate transport system substrate-binding protein